MWGFASQWYVDSGAVTTSTWPWKWAILRGAKPILSRSAAPESTLPPAVSESAAGQSEWVDARPGPRPANGRLDRGSDSPSRRGPQAAGTISRHPCRRRGNVSDRQRSNDRRDRARNRLLV